MCCLIPQHCDTYPLLYYYYYYYYYYYGAHFTVLKISKHCPLVLPVKVAWKEDKGFGSDESSALAVDFWTDQYQKDVEHLD